MTGPGVPGLGRRGSRRRCARGDRSARPCANICSRRADAESNGAASQAESKHAPRSSPGCPGDVRQYGLRQDILEGLCGATRYGPRTCR